MRKTMLVGTFLVVVAGLAVRAAQEQPMPKPSKEHEWLRQLEGTWEGESYILIDPADPTKKLETPFKMSKVTETTRMVGGFWAVSTIKGEMFGQPFEAQGQFGYDAGKGKYVGTWIDSMMPFFWTYEGSVDASGKTLTFEAMGPSCEDPTRMAKYRDAHEIVDKNTRRMSSALEKDGKWVPMLKAELKRTK